jgi:hypothetical protein
MNNLVIIKAGASFITESRYNGINFDLTLDENVNAKLYHNALITIGGTNYMYGTIYITNPNPADLSVTLAKDTKYHVNNREYDPHGFTKLLDIPQKVRFNNQTSIILPSSTILHTVDNLLEFQLTKSTPALLN